MANVTLLDFPDPVCFTRNPMLFRFDIAPNLPADAQLRVKIMVAGEEISLFYPLQNTTVHTQMDVDIASVVDAYVSVPVPALDTANLTSLQQWPATTVSVWYYLVSATVNETGYAFYYSCYKAGIGSLLDANERRVNMQDQQALEGSYLRQTATPTGLLTWMPKVRPIWRAPAWVAWYMNDPVDGTAAARVRYRTVFRSGATLETLKPMPTGFMLDGTIWFVPIGLQQIGTIQNLSASQLDLIHRVEVEFVVDTMASYTAISKSIVLRPDRRPASGSKTVYWQNDFGGLECWRFRGKNKATTTAVRKDMEMLKGSPFGAVNQVFSATMQPKWLLHSGWVSRDVSAALNSLMLAHNAAFLFNQQFVPLNISSAEMEWDNNDAQTLHGAQIEFVLAKPVNLFPAGLLKDLDS